MFSFSNPKTLLGAIGLVGAVTIAGGLLLVSTANTTPSGATASPTMIATASPTASVVPSSSGAIETEALPAGYEYSDLDGVAAPADLAHRMPIVMMIDDHRSARPQSGFSSASIVWQAMADGGEDRYMVVWQEGSASEIGPVRSARPYFVYWATEYRPVFGHIGGDAVTLQQTAPAEAKASRIFNMDGMNYYACPYSRITTRPAPHNDYTSTEAVLKCMARRQYPTTYRGKEQWSFREDTPHDTLPSTQAIDIPYRTGTIGYRFDPASDSYQRLVDGATQVDPASGDVVTARNVVILFQTYDMVPSIDHERPYVGQIGTGDAIVFQEGKAKIAKWRKSSNGGLTRFYVGSTEISMLRGRTFLQSVPISTKVTYTPQG